MKLININYLKELLFSERRDRLSSSINQCDKLTTEFIKIMEMYDRDPDDVKHWIDGLYSCINQCYSENTGYKNMLLKILVKNNKVSDEHY